GVEGNMVYDILAVTRKEGTYTIAPVVFTYYDTHTNSYKTLRTQSFTVNVAKGDGTVGTVSDYTAVKDEDIHGIMEGKITRRSVSEFFYGSVGYWIIVALLVAAIAVVLFMFRRTAIERADIARLRGKNANKVATRRLRKASSLMKKNSPDEFYDEVLRALWGYVGDKLNMPATELSRDNISERLASHGVDDATIDKFIGALDECEYMRYAPGDARGNMNRTFEAAMTAITDIEGVMKKQKKASASQPGTSAMMLLAVIVMLLGSPLFSLPANAITKDNADTEYKKGNYLQAVKDYQELLKGGPSAELYYNLGNAYYRLENITQAVLAYERALQLSPGDDDIRFNLQMARQKTIDKITPESEMFFVTWWNQLVSIMGVDTWAYTALISLALFVLLLLVYLMADRVALRKLGFYGGLLLLLLFVLSNVCAAIQRSHIEERSGAVVISSSASVKKIPTATSAEAFLLHEGTKVKIRDRSIKNWFGVKLEDGREGWIESRHLEII
ncbi:MAG: BatD family protein, partial [Prevotella sp.]|nr:BatD family protein [Prevotella sp.]